MRQKLQMRYWCDHCKKAGSRGPAMLKHERSCTLNWDRSCRMCEALGNSQQPADELWNAFQRGGFDELRKLCEECPACTLMVLRRFWKIDADPCTSLTDGDGRYSYDFKADCAAWIAALREQKAEDGYY